MELLTMSDRDDHSIWVMPYRTQILKVIYQRPFLRISQNKLRGQLGAFSPFDADRANSAEAV